ncbi:MAG: aminotransferase class V-fold PLP-dependent enzyme [Pseudomonadota bacterium]|nr:aminotransferase class V-fold PLP-dependent enzyme [Pseudomonadota bacterium]
MKPHSMDWDSYCREFESTSETLWLNHAGISRTSRSVARAMTEYATEMGDVGAVRIDERFQRATDMKSLAARMLGCEGENLSITSGTAFGINMVAEGYPWEAGDEVVLCSVEYPANVYPWWAQKRKGVRLVWVDPDEDNRIPVERYAAAITEKTRVVAVSHVQFSSGYRHDLEALGRLCREAGCLLVVDAFQAFSIFPIEIHKWGIDALSFGSHKWLQGPTGIGMFYCSPGLRDRLRPLFPGASSVKDPFNFLDYHFDLLEDGRRFEGSMPNLAGCAGLHAALELAAGFGRENLAEKIRQYSDELIAIFERHGFQNHSPRGEGEWSGIVSLTHPDVAADAVFQGLKCESVNTLARDGRLRLSPHAYHRPEELQRVALALARSLTA